MEIKKIKGEKMKIIITQLYVLIFVCLITNLNAQEGVAINSSGAAADASAILDVSSTTQGFLPPRMTETQRDAISSPATGLLIYQTNGSSGLYYFNGSSWETFLTGKHYIGESYGGGIVFWVDATGQHGLIAATADQSTSMRWYAGSYTNTMAQGDGIGASEMNTAIIIANQGYGDGATYAARVCAEYQAGGYGDWYLPSKYELNLMFSRKGTIGGFATDTYWSSTEISNNLVAAQHFAYGLQYNADKWNTVCVRAIRKF